VKAALRLNQLPQLSAATKTARKKLCECSAIFHNCTSKASNIRGAPGLVQKEISMAEQLRIFLRLKQVIAATGMSRSWLYDAIRRGVFPAPIQLGARAVAWDSLAVADWQAARINKFNEATA
jgi:prophage regulatory protein